MKIKRRDDDMSIVIIRHINHRKRIIVRRLLHNSNSLSEGKIEHIKKISRLRNIFYENGKVSYSNRCNILNQKGIVIWLTGLSGVGKSTISIEIEKELVNMGKLVYRLDGDNLRTGLNANLGFSEKDRVENIRRVIEVSYLFKDAGLITLVSIITPYNSMRDMARTKIGSDFIEIYVKADINSCIKRDPKGLYNKALKGEIDNFTGISAPFEEPINPDLIIDTVELTVKDACDKILNFIIPKIDLNKD